VHQCRHRGGCPCRAPPWRQKQTKAGLLPPPVVPTTTIGTVCQSHFLLFSFDFPNCFPKEKERKNLPNEMSTEWGSQWEVEVKGRDNGKNKRQTPLRPGGERRIFHTLPHHHLSIGRMGTELDCALDLMRRMPPSSIEDNLAGLIDLVPDLTEQLLSMVDQPLKVAHDAQAHRDYLLCDYNRDGDSYRYRAPQSLFPSLHLQHFLMMHPKVSLDQQVRPAASRWCPAFDPAETSGGPGQRCF